MAKRPSFQFYPADWRNNAKLRRCSEAARGAWIDVLCLLHDSDEYGVLRWPLADIARATGLPLKLLKELADRDVLKGGDKGCDAYVHTPTHARKKGDPIILLSKTDGACWYSSRFLVDEWKRSVSGGNTRFQSPDVSPSHGKVNGEVNKNQSPHASPDTRLGAGATTTSTSTTKVIESGNNSESTSTGSGQKAAPLANTDNPTPGQVCGELNKLKVSGVNPGHVMLTTLLESGATMAEFTGAAQDAIDKGKGSFNYILGIVKGRREEAKATAGNLVQGAIKKTRPWYLTATGTEAKAAELGITIDPKSESFPHLQAKVFAACQITPEIIRTAREEFPV